MPTANIRLIYRWCWSPVEIHTLPDGSTVKKLIVADYSSRPESVRTPLFFEDGPSLSYCEFLPELFLAARQDPRIVILDSLHSRRSVHQTVTAHGELHAHTGQSIHEQVHVQLTKYGITPDQNTHDLLLTMHHALKGDVGYIPSE